MKTPAQSPINAGSDTPRVNHRLRVAVAGLLASSVCLASLPAHAQSAVENLDLSTQVRQEITGWGLFTYSHRTAWGSYYDLNNAAVGVTAAADQMFSLDINTLRLELPAEAYDAATGGIRQAAIDDVADAVMRARTFNTLSTTRTRAVDYLLTVWSLPRQMKMACKLSVQSNGQPGDPTNECFPNNGFETGRLQMRSDGAYAVYGGGLLNPQPAGVAGLPPGYYFSAVAHGQYDRTDESTKYLIDALTALRKSSAGLPYAISMQNEPGHLPDYDGTYYAAANYQRAVRKLKQALLATRGTTNDLSSVQVVFGDVNAANDLQGAQMNLGYNFENFYGAHDGLDATHSYTDVLAFHTYDQFQSADVRLANQRDTSALLWNMAGHPDTSFRKPVWMTEWSIESLGYPGSQPIDGAIYELGHMLRDLRVYPIERYIWWRAWSYAYGEQSGDLLMSNYGDVPQYVTWRPRKIFHALKRIWKEVPAAGGFKVRPLQYATGQTGDLSVSALPTTFTTNALAFRNDSKTVIVVSNPDATMEKSVTVNGVGGTSAVQYRTDGLVDDQLVTSPPQITADGSVIFNVAPRSINVIVVDAAGGGGGTGGDGDGGGVVVPSCTPNQLTSGSTTINVTLGSTASTTLRTSESVNTLTDLGSGLTEGQGSIAYLVSGRRITVTVDLRGATTIQAGAQIPYQFSVDSALCSTPKTIGGVIQVSGNSGPRVKPRR